MLHQAPDQIAFPQLSPEQIRQIGELGSLHVFEDGETIISAGRREYPFCLVQSGEIAIVDLSSGEPRDVVVHGSGGFVGDVDILTGRPAVIAAVARGKTTAWLVEAAKVRLLLNEVPDLSELLLEAFQLRREQLQASEFLGLRVIGLSQSKETASIRGVLLKEQRSSHFF